MLESGLLKSRQYALDLLAMRFKKFWQLQCPAKCLDRLVNGETGNIGRYLEQNATRLAEIDRTKVIAVLLVRRTLVVRSDEFLRHLRLLCVVRCAKGDVMHRAAPLMSSQKSPGLVNVDDAALGVFRCRVAGH